MFCGGGKAFSLFASIGGARVAVVGGVSGHSESGGVQGTASAYLRSQGGFERLFRDERECGGGVSGSGEDSAFISATLC